MTNPINIAAMGAKSLLKALKAPHSESLRTAVGIVANTADLGALSPIQDEAFTTVIGAAQIGADHREALLEMARRAARTVAPGTVAIG